MQLKSELPEEWAECQINDIITINYGKGLKKSDRIEGQFDVFGSNGIVGKHNKSLTNGPTIIIGRKGSVGEINFSSESCWPIDTTYYIDNFYGVNRFFLYNLLKTLNLANYDTSTAIPGINRNDIYSIVIPLPPLAEQHRIVSAIEALFARLDAANERLDRVPEILKKFRQSVLAAAFDGRLNEDCRVIVQNSKREYAIFRTNTHTNSINSSEDPIILNSTVLSSLPNNWCWATIEQLASTEPRSIQSGPFGSNLLHSEFQDTGILAIGIDNVHDRSFSLGKEHRISNEKYKELKKYTARPLDVLITVMATVGRCCVVPKDIETAIITKHVYRITPNGDILSSYYLMNALSGATIVKKQIEQQTRGQTRPGINGKILKTTSIPLPPLPEQHEIVRRVDALFALADLIEAKVVAARKKTEKLRQSILAKAFSGELVETEAELARQEGRDYEPADVLLERIKAEQRKSGKKGKTAKGKSTHLKKL